MIAPQPPRFRSSNKELEAALNALSGYVAQAVAVGVGTKPVKAGVDLLHHESDDGITFDANPVDPVTVFPFKVISTQTKDGKPAVAVQAGYVMSGLLPGLEFPVPLAEPGKAIKVGKSNTEVFVTWDVQTVNITKKVSEIETAVKKWITAAVAKKVKGKKQTAAAVLKSLGISGAKLKAAVTLLKANYYGEGTGKNGTFVPIGVKGVKAKLVPHGTAASVAVADIVWLKPNYKTFSVVQNVESAICYPFDPLTVLPWIGIGVGSSSGGGATSASGAGGEEANKKLAVWFGDSPASFTKGKTVVTPKVAALHQFGIEIRDPKSKASSSMILTVGDKKPKDNDGLWFTGGADRNTLSIQWNDYPVVAMEDGKGGHSVHLGIEHHQPSLLLRDHDKGGGGGSSGSGGGGKGRNEVEAAVTKHGPLLSVTTSGKGVLASVKSGKATLIVSAPSSSKKTVITNEKINTTEGFFLGNVKVVKELSCKTLKVGKYVFSPAEATYCVGKKEYSCTILVAKKHGGGGKGSGKHSGA